MESTSIYWMPIWRILEPYFIQKLVSPYFIKQLPGKKSDMKDAEWIATCLLKNLIRGSYVPDERIQQLRQYDRSIADLNDDIGKIKSRRITHGNKYLRKTLIECSWAASKTQGCFYNKFSYHQTVVRRRVR